MLLIFFPGADDFFLGGGVRGWSLTPFFGGPNLLVRVKLGYTPNFAALGYVEVP